MLKLHVLHLLLSIFSPPQKANNNCFYEISRYLIDKKPVVIYKNACLGSDADFIYKVTVFKTLSKSSTIERQFVIRTAPDCVKKDLGAQYVLSEILEKSTSIIDYPYLWQTKSIDIEDLKSNCTTILKNEAYSTKLCL